MQSYIKKIQNLDESQGLDILRGYEGNIGRIYFRTVSETLPDEYKFKSRELRGAKSKYNIVLNYLFGILYRKVTKEMLKMGFELGIGIIHKENNYNDPFLYDYIEQFRGTCLGIAYKYFDEGLASKEHFEKNKNGLILTRDGKRVILDLIYEKFDENIKFKRKNYDFNGFLKQKLLELKKQIMGFGEER